MDQERKNLSNTPLAPEIVAEFCRKHGIRELSLFGSVLREDFRPQSDVDVLIEFEPETAVSLFDLIQIQDELALLLGREVDLVEKAGLSPFLRDRILSSREVQYVRA